MKPALTVAENLGFWRDWFAAMREEAPAGLPPSGPSSSSPASGLLVGEALDAVGLGEVAGLPFGYLSTGQRRRVAIARLLLDRRPLWLLDEPGSGLDRAAQAALARLMRAHLAGGGLLVAAVHDDPGLSDAGEIVLGAG